MVKEVACSGRDSEPRGVDPVDVVLAAVPRSISRARSAVRALMDAVPGLPPEVAEDVLLLVSELVTNAVMHARTAVHLVASGEPGRILVAVGDDDPEHAPLSSERGAMATSGRGMRLVDLLATDWGVEVQRHSKVVWFETTYDTSPLAVNGV